MKIIQLASLFVLLGTATLYASEDGGPGDEGISPHERLVQVNHVHGGLEDAAAVLEIKKELTTTQQELMKTQEELMRTKAALGQAQQEANEEWGRRVIYGKKLSKAIEMIKEAYSELEDMHAREDIRSGLELNLLNREQYKSWEKSLKENIGDPMKTVIRVTDSLENFLDHLDDEEKEEELKDSASEGDDDAATADDEL